MPPPKSTVSGQSLPRPFQLCVMVQLPSPSSSLISGVTFPSRGVQGSFLFASHMLSELENASPGVLSHRVVHG